MASRFPRVSDSSAAVAAALLARLREGTAKFELLEDSAPAPEPAPSWPRLHCFARIAPSLRGGWSAALNKVEHYGVQRVTGDGRCMFRALVSCSIISFRARSMLMDCKPLLL